MKTIRAFVAAAALGFTLSAGAQQPAGDLAAQPPATAATAATEPRSEGEVRKVNLEQGKLTLRHGPLANLDMPAMTMVFTAADKKLLEGLKEGDKVKFTADKQNGVYVLTAIEAVR